MCVCVCVEKYASNLFPFLLRRKQRNAAYLPARELLLPVFSNYRRFRRGLLFLRLVHHLIVSHKNGIKKKIHLKENQPHTTKRQLLPLRQNPNRCAPIFPPIISIRLHTVNNWIQPLCVFQTPNSNSGFTYTAPPPAQPLVWARHGARGHGTNLAIDFSKNHVKGSCKNKIQLVNEAD